MLSIRPGRNLLSAAARSVRPAAVPRRAVVHSRPFVVHGSQDGSTASRAFTLAPAVCRLPDARPHVPPFARAGASRRRGSLPSPPPRPRRARSTILRPLSARSPRRLTPPRRDALSADEDYRIFEKTRLRNSIFVKGTRSSVRAPPARRGVTRGRPRIEPRGEPVVRPPRVSPVVHTRGIVIRPPPLGRSERASL